MLGGQDLSGSKQRRLASGIDGLQHGAGGDHRFSRAHLALQQTHHG